MLTLVEKIVFLALVLASLAATGLGSYRLIRIIGQGRGTPDWRPVRSRLWGVFKKMVAFQPVFRFRVGVSIFHALVGWGFVYYLLVNFADLLYVFTGQSILGGWFGDAYRLLADFFSAAVLIGVVFFVVRRFIFKPANLSTRQSTLLQPNARKGMRRDSAIVAGMIFLHVGARFAGETFRLTASGQPDPWQPLAMGMAGLWSGMDASVLSIAQHISFWLAMGTILVFLPYFPYSKHIHIFFAPLNYLLKPKRTSIGEMGYIDLDDQSIESFGASSLADLGWEQLVDAYACIMCFRCQEVCPAYQTGKVLSPAALEINKRYMLNSVNIQSDISLPAQRLTESVISPEAVWACTACGACVDICPVGNEPMRDILDVRRNLVLVENDFPRQLEVTFRNLERTANPWGVAASERMKWAEGLSVPTIEQGSDPDVLWWVGCAPATDSRAQKTARAFARILAASGTRYAVLGQAEQCTGDAARRAGREDIFFSLARANVEALNAVNPKRIVTTCPHCLHVLKNEYPAFGGRYQVIHHTQFIEELIRDGKLELESNDNLAAVAFHDPCYLGRQNGVVREPRQALEAVGARLKELPRHAQKSFCCGAGGAQVWKEEEPGELRLSQARLAEAQACGVETLAVGCPFCLTMLTDAAKAGTSLEVRDVAEIVAERLK